MLNTQDSQDGNSIQTSKTTANANPAMISMASSDISQQNHADSINPSASTPFSSSATLASSSIPSRIHVIEKVEVESKEKKGKKWKHPSLYNIFHSKNHSKTDSNKPTKSSEKDTNPPASLGTPGNAALESLGATAYNRIARLPAREEEWLQKDSDIFERLKWTQTNRAKLFGYIEELRTQVTDLECILRLKSTSSIFELPESSKERLKVFQQTVAITQVSLTNLHRSLRMMNRKGNPWVLSLQLAGSFEESGADFLSSHDYLPLREKCVYFTLQRRASMSEKQSKLFVAEIPLLPSSASSPSTIPMAIDLEQAQEYQNIPVNQSHSENQFSKWGVVRRSETEELHWLFHDQTSKWQSCGTLLKTLGDPLTDEKMKIAQRIRLAILIILSYIYLLDVRQSCDPITLKSFEYFSEEGDDSTWDEEEPLILYPYLSFGFGQRPKDNKIGGKRKAPKGRGTEIVGLGIKLVEIGCCKVLSNSEGSSSLSDSKSSAMNQLHKLEESATMLYAEIARDCLQYSSPSVSTGGSAEENGFLAKIAIRMEDLQQGLAESLAGDIKGSDRKKLEV